MKLIVRKDDSIERNIPAVTSQWCNNVHCLLVVYNNENRTDNYIFQGRKLIESLCFSNEGNRHFYMH
jgi:hypothetical protein